MFAAEAAQTTVPWLYENVWLIPALPAASFLLIIFFGKRLPFKGAEIGITAVLAAFVLAVLTTFTWIGNVESGDSAVGTAGAIEKKAEEHGSSDEEHDDEDHGPEQAADRVWKLP